MEEQLAYLLAETQSNNDANRKQAELQLKQLYHDQNFPLGLVSLANHDSVPLNIRQSALLVCKKFVEVGWSSNLDEYRGQVLMDDANKATLRQNLLDIALSDHQERRVKSAASLVVSKIATADFPEDWPNLLPDLLTLIPQASDGQLHGALKVLQDLVEDCINEEQFFKVAHDLVRTLHSVAVNGSRKPTLRALAIGAFRSSFDTLEMIMEDHKAAVKGFAEQTLMTWIPFFLDVIKVKLPDAPIEDEDETDQAAVEYHRGMVALKFQVVKTLLRIRIRFPSVLAQHSLELFSATWDELGRLQSQYHATYINDDRQGRLEDADGLPYTLDFLILEELDFLNTCLRAPPVKKELERQLQSSETSEWTNELIKLAANYSHITSEEEGLWEIDINIYLAEESHITANYTPRSACGDLMVKLSEWIPEKALGGLLAHSKAASSWKAKEATLFLLDAMLRELQSLEKSISAELSHSFVDIVNQSMQAGDIFLRARGQLVAGSLVKISGSTLSHAAPTFMQSCLNTMLNDESDIVKISCVRALQQYLPSMKQDMTRESQATIIGALSQYLSQQDMNDMDDNEDVMLAFLETLRDIIVVDTRICLQSDALRLLFVIANHGASSFPVSMVVTETFEEVSSTLAEKSPEEFSQLCDRVLPSLLGAFDMLLSGAGTDANNNSAQPLANLSGDMLSVLAENSPSPLPRTFVPQSMPRLKRLLLESNDDDLIRSATTATQYILEHDAEVVFAWHDEDGKGGLETLLVIIDRLLGPSIDDVAGAEVGGLAVAIVEKAGSERLGPYLTQLLQAVAVRLSTAERSVIIQSLIMVFARLTIVSAADVVGFLASIDIGGESGLQVVMTKWLENSVHFAGFDEIGQNNIALTKLYELSSPQLSSVIVKGDLIVPQSSRIMTRSRAKQTPTEYTKVDANLKIIKLLVEELPSSPGGGAAAINAATRSITSTAATAGGDDPNDDEDEDDADDDEWEDDDNDFLDLGSGMTKADLMAYGEGSGPSGGTPGAWQRSDDEGQKYLVAWFGEVARSPGFEAVFGQLSEAEREKLRSLLG